MAIYQSAAPHSSVLEYFWQYLSVPTSNSASSLTLSRNNKTMLPAPPNSSNPSLNQALLGWSATVGVSLLLLLWVGKKDEEKSPLDWVSDWVSRIWTLEQAEHVDDRRETPRQSRKKRSKSKASSKGTEASDPRVVHLHRGSCHCGSITFKLATPRTVETLHNSSPGKLQYACARIPSEDFCLSSGKNVWGIYHVKSQEGDTWAYSFCRQCAVHLLHATDADQSSVFVNVQCFVNNSRSNKSDSTRSFPRTDMSEDQHSITTALPELATLRTPSSSIERLHSSPLSYEDFVEDVPQNLEGTSVPSVLESTPELNSHQPVRLAVPQVHGGGYSRSPVVPMRAAVQEAPRNFERSAFTQMRGSHVPQLPPLPAVRPSGRDVPRHPQSPRKIQSPVPTAHEARSNGRLFHRPSGRESPRSLSLETTPEALPVRIPAPSPSKWARVDSRLFGQPSLHTVEWPMDNEDSNSLLSDTSGPFMNGSVDGMTAATTNTLNSERSAYDDEKSPLVATAQLRYYMRKHMSNAQARQQS